MRTRCHLLVVLLVALSALPAAALQRKYTDAEEGKLGKEGAAEVEKEFKVLKDAKQLARVEGILKVIAPVTERPKVVYKAKILDTDDINAFSLPGGYIYVTRRLLETVGSDDELAGVLAHEVAHNTHFHSLEQLERSAKLEQKVMLAVIAAVLVGREHVDPGTLLFLGTVLKLNAVNGYGQRAEVEADDAAVDYLIKSKQYNPNGVLQFMERLLRAERQQPEVPLGIFQTHPPTRERVDDIRAQLTAAGIPIVRLPGKDTPTAEARSVTVNGREIAEVVLRDQPLFQPAVEKDGQKPLARAEESARRVSGIFREYAEGRHVRVRAEGEARVLYYRDSPLLEITPADAQFHHATPDELAARAEKALRAVIWSDFVKHAY
ncbi:MAG: M48 family metalloprotease [Armatimonadetes bacterium]|nr:M48 family metalloprotease [Armatimonadota bacterium]